MSLYMSRNRACDSRPEGRNRCDHHMLTNCRAPVRGGKPRRCLTSRRLLPRTGSPGVWQDPSPYNTFEYAVAFTEGMGGRRSSHPKARQSTDVAARTRYRYTCRISRAWEFGVARAGANGMSFNKTEAGAGATTSGRATAAEVSIDRQIDPQDQFAKRDSPGSASPIWLVLPSKMVLFHALQSRRHRSRRA